MALYDFMLLCAWCLTLPTLGVEIWKSHFLGLNFYRDLQEPVENWPVCDCLISFHSKGFPLDKAIQYANLRNPFIINNLHMQYDIQDRRKVYSILAKEGIEIPRYAVLDRDSPDPKRNLNWFS